MRRIDLEAQLEQHHEAAFGWALSCCDRDRPMAEDVLQATYLKVLDGRAVFRERSSFKTWLFAVIRRTAAEQRRRRAILRFVPLARLEGRVERRSTAPDPEAVLVSTERTAQLVAALDKLPSRQREVLHLVFYQELSVAESAEVLGVSVGTARTHYERGKSRLRTLLEEPERS
jgi:RNA polymerase sigma-70 factor (ECF subfamily)